MECKDCGSELEKISAPAIKLEIPLGRYSIQIMDWGHEEEICTFCMNEENQQPEREIYEHGCEDGYTKAYEKYGRDPW